MNEIEFLLHLGVTRPIADPSQEEFAKMLHWRDRTLWTITDKRSWCELRPSEQAHYRNEAAKLVDKHRTSLPQSGEHTHD